MESLSAIELQIELNKTYVKADLDENISFPINIQFTDITDPTVTKINYSTQISLPNTKRNSDIFSSMWKVDAAIHNFTPLLRTNFRLYTNNNLYQTGYIKLEEVTFTAYKIRLFGGLGDYFYTMSEISEERDMRLRSLEFGDTFTHDIKKELIYNCWNGNTYNGKSGRLNDLLAYIPTYQGQYENFDNDSVIKDGEIEPIDATWKVGSREYTSPDLDENRRSFYVGNKQYFGEYRSYYQKPMIKLKEIFNKIIEVMKLEGWNTELDKTFFNEHNPYWHELWMLCPNYSTTEDAAATNLRFVDNVNKTQPTSAPSGPNTYHFYGKEVANKKEEFHFGLNTNDILAKTSYSLLYDINFLIKAVYAETSNGTPQKSMRMRKSATLTAKLWIGSKSYPMTFNPGGTTLVLSDETIATKAPKDFSQPTYTWTSSKALQPFYYYYRQSENSNTKESVVDGTQFNLKGIINISETDFPIAPDKIYLEFTFNGNTYWFRSSSGTNTNDRTYAICLDMLEGDKSSIKISNPEAAGTRSGVTIRYGNIINSEATCYDFISSYCKLFGLYFVKDPVLNEVTIMTRNSFFADQERVDWTYKIDYSKEFTIRPIPFDYKIGVFRWNNLSSKYESEYLSETAKEYGSVRFNTGYQFSDNIEYLLDGIIFDNCIIAQDYSNYYTGRNPFLYRDNKALPHLQDTSGTKINNGFILLFSNGIAETLDKTPFIISDDSALMSLNGYCWTEEPGAFLESTNYLQVVRTKNYGDRNYSLEFGNPSRVYNDLEEEIRSDNTEDGGDTIYGRFWRGYLKDRFDKENKFLTCYVNLTLQDIQNNLFNKFIFINNTIWVLNKVYNFDPLKKQTTKVELVSVQSIDAYLSQQYVEGKLTITRGEELLYNSSGTTSIVIIRESSTNLEITLTIDSTIDWKIGTIADEITVNPSSATSGVRSLKISIPENATGTIKTHSIPLRWGNTTTIIQIIQIANWTVTSSSNVGTATANGETGTIQVSNGTSVSFESTGTTGYGFGYWYINKQHYYENPVTLMIQDDTNAQAWWYNANTIVRMGCNDNNTSIPTLSRYDAYWFLTIGQPYTFNNTQTNLSGYLFGADAAYTNPANSVTRSIIATDTTLTVFYDTLLANIKVINNTATQYDMTTITIKDPSAETIPSPSGTVEPGETLTYKYAHQTTRYGTYSFESSHPAETYVTISPASVNYQRRSTISTVNVTVSELKWQNSTLSVIANGGTVTNELKIPAGLSFNITSDTDGVTISPASGTGTTTGTRAVSVTIPQNTAGRRIITLTALISSGATTIRQLLFTIEQESGLAPAELSIQPVSQTLSSAINVYNINVTSNTTWQASIDENYSSWLTILDEASGSGDGRIQVRASGNSSLGAPVRTGYIEFTTTRGEDDVSVTHTVKQNPY